MTRVVGLQHHGDGSDRKWIPDNPDGSGWAPVDWVSAVRGSRYHYRHGAAREIAQAALPPFYRVVTRLESADMEPHENTYFVPSDRLADFLAEIAFAGGAEVLWHVEPEFEPPVESRVQASRDESRYETG
ncbi:MAG TPA: hypothetical protein VGR16_08825 [Thermomicrobiales bacterium]|nr:hypothetical protein [Thermomicrobiales bacterium]